MTDELHASSIVIDHACPLVVPDMTDDFVNKLKVGGITVAMATVATNDTFREAMDAIAAWGKRFECDTRLLRVTGVADIRRAKQENKIGIGFHFQNSRPIEYDLSLLTLLQQLGVRVLQLTYNERNLAGDGCTERTDSGLSQFGVDMVAETNRLGIVVDLAHVGYRSSMDAIEVSKTPAIVSHSNAWSLCPSRRNLKDDQIKAIAAKGGVIGVNAFPWFVKKEKPRLADLLDHVDYIAKLVGAQHVGIGFDYSQSDPADFRRWNYSPEVYPLPPWVYPEDIDDTSKTPNFTRGLQSRGYSEAAIRGILGENFMRVFNQVWRA